MFAQFLESRELDVALLLPSARFTSYEDEHTVHTADAIDEEFDRRGLFLCYRGDENLDEALE